MAVTPPGKGLIPGVRSPSFGRQQASVRGARSNLGNTGASGICGSLHYFLTQQANLNLVPSLC